MSRRTLINLVLVILVAGLAAFITLTPERREPVHLEALSDENPRAISHIRLQPVQGPAISLRRSEGVWYLTDPIRIAANDFRVSALVGVLSAPVHARIEASAEELGRFGLAPPRGRVRLDDIEILFGDTQPLNGRRYLLYDGRVALVDDAYFSHLSSSAANYVDLSVLGRDANPREIELTDLRIYREGDTWRLDATDKQASAEAITNLVDAWRNAQATAVRPYEPSLDWKEQIRVELADRQLRFDLARTEYEVILGRSDLQIQYHLTKTTGARLLNLSPADDDS